MRLLCFLFALAAAAGCKSSASGPCGDPKLEWPARVEENALMAAMIRTVTDHNIIEFRSFENTDHGSCLGPSVKYICKAIGGAKD